MFAGAALQEATLSGPLSKQPLNAQIKGQMGAITICGLPNLFFIELGARLVFFNAMVFQGIKTLAQGEEPITVDIVLVHRIYGDALDTWTSEAVC